MVTPLFTANSFIRAAAAATSLKELDELYKHFEAYLDSSEIELGQHLTDEQNAARDAIMNARQPINNAYKLKLFVMEVGLGYTRDHVREMLRNYLKTDIIVSDPHVIEASDDAGINYKVAIARASTYCDDENGYIWVPYILMIKPVEEREG
jgi:hypothetical protein